MTDIKKNARAEILPAGAQAPVATLSTGQIRVKVLKLVSDGGRDKDVEVEVAKDGKLIKEILSATEFGERFYAHCQYPDGFTREHQVKTTDELIAKITRQLRGRYGANPLNIVARPDLAEGIDIVMEA